MQRLDADLSTFQIILIGLFVGIGIVLGVLLLAVLAARLLAYFATRSLVRSKPTALNPTSYVFSPEGIEYSNPTSSGRFDWSTYLRIRETPDQFLLFVQKRFANFLPKRAFASDEQMQAFRSLARAHFKGVIEFNEKS
ncbi:MAG TPA: YcxB family protein [Candidatus Acidoferrales bacterium]|nr:YcxB family protein [Candidatus Acidoferrales bacterium]